MKKINWMDILTIILLIAAINLGITGFFDFNVIEYLIYGLPKEILRCNPPPCSNLFLGQTLEWILRGVYAIFGVAGVIVAYIITKEKLW